MQPFLILISVAGVLVVGCLLLYLLIRIVWRAWARNQALVRYGVETQAEVIEQVQKTAWEGSALYFITYRYLAPTSGGEQPFTSTEQVWFTEFDHYPVGTRLQVRYLPSNPKVVLRSPKIIGRS